MRGAGEAMLGRGERWKRPPIGVRQRFVGNKFAEESFDRCRQHAIGDCLLASSVENDGSAFGVVLPESLESGEVFCPDPGGVLDFDGDEVGWRVDDEIDFQSGACAPEVKCVAFSGIVEPCPEMLEDKPFESHPIDFLWPVQGPFGAECAVNPGIEEVELAVCYRLALRSLREYGEASRDEHFLKNLEIGINRGAFHFGFAGDGACGENRTVGERCGFEEPGKHVKVADQAFVDDFFLKIEVEISPEYGLWLLDNGIADKWNHPELKRFLKIEVFSHFRGKKRMAKALDGAASKKVCALGTFELSGVGACEYEALVTILFDEVVDCIEQGRNSLDLIYYDGFLVCVCCHDINKAFWPRRQGTAHIGFKKIYGECLWELMSEPHRLSGAARSEKEETTTWKAYHSFFHGAYDSIFCPAKSTMIFHR